MNQFLNTKIDIKQMPWPPHNPLPACAGNCQQGRHACRTPDLCNTGLNDDGEEPTLAESMQIYCVILGVPAVVLCVALAFALWE
jgi:hypothetical protein